MIDFRVIRLTSGESFLCIVESETNNTINVLFPLTIKTHAIPMGGNVLREIHSTTIFCPFTDDKCFSFHKNEITFNKPLSSDAIPYYVDMLNRHEDEQSLKDYNLSELIAEPPPPSQLDMEIEQKVNNLLNKMEEIEEETQDPSVATGNKTVH